MQCLRALGRQRLQLGSVGSRQRAICCAKKGSGGKGKPGKESKISGLLAKKAEKEKATIASADQYRNPEVRALLLFICSSYYKHTKKPLIEAEFDTLPDALFNAPFVLLAHDKFQAGVTDPKFIYANRAGLELFDATWDTLIGLPSRKSAADEPGTQSARNQLLANAADTGVITNYEGWRVSLKGRKFRIKGVTLFNVEDAEGEVIGQAATFERYETDKGQEVVVQGYAEAVTAAVQEAAAAAPPSQEEIDAAQAAVKQWGDYIRGLKAQGRDNKDPDVMQAVGNLNAWKAQLAGLQQRLESALAAAKAAFDDEDEDWAEGEDEGSDQSQEGQHQGQAVAAQAGTPASNGTGSH